ncbi:hypothetical protein CBL_03990 [Carabus blaptoides fortunei]
MACCQGTSEDSHITQGTDTLQPATIQLDGGVENVTVVLTENLHTIWSRIDYTQAEQPEGPKHTGISLNTTLTPCELGRRDRSPHGRTDIGKDVGDVRVRRGLDGDGQTDRNPDKPKPFRTN